uniref:Uncharacterized protein n=1 Tax=Anopheles albimanus TaxID=7167 RepID=A0A3F2YQ58_ANOAL
MWREMSGPFRRRRIAGACAINPVCDMSECFSVGIVRVCT